MGRCTEMGRVVGNDAMDVIGGAGICKGPMNYMAAKCVHCCCHWAYSTSSLMGWPP